MERKRHIVFFDAECPFCQRLVRFLISIDKHKILLFAALDGQTAEDILSGPLAHYKKVNSIIFLEDFESTERQFYIRSKAIHRIYWLIGGKWKFFGLFFWLPSFPFDLFYRTVAGHRHQFKLKPLHPVGPEDRFLN